MQNMEESNKALTERLLTTDSSLILLYNILVIAVAAGIAEEFFFRGCLQQMFKKIFNNGNLAVCLTAVIFSAIHFQFYGFIPRLILGMILGYMFLWSRNLWVSSIAHIINNMVAILIFHFYHGSEIYNKAETLGATRGTLWVSAVSAVLSCLILFMLLKLSSYNKAKRVSSSPTR
jgi:membrane protease YdiL (CAAX protease family)